MLVLPTVPGQIAGAMAAVTQLMAKLDKLPLDRMGESLRTRFGASTGSSTGPSSSNA